MNMQITGRHVEITDTIRDYVQTRLGPILAEYPSVEHAHVILSVEKFRHLAEIVVQGKPHLRAEAEAETEDMYKSIDLMAEKIERQLRRVREKIVDHKHRAKPSAG